MISFKKKIHIIHCQLIKQKRAQAKKNKPGKQKLNKKNYSKNKINIQILYNIQLKKHHQQFIKINYEYQLFTLIINALQLPFLSPNSAQYNGKYYLIQLSLRKLIIK
ncbi:hypothetical protein PPERSA_10281 [Pseudocohnilembus persalinus]|uniref:Uncharacterized protein n=1 Tax=Pseudocohnilembus persalinus TaxID=266149 RepID=A0A0V0R156_PSEPJ|nr:hypothetical protein PPERSA_10281 [Pseudocohnilembus persalinus]|eukprot:KRX07893.1 hypothetical protein PPERSA_10281 [Pseudocohnilembus persalinus]